MDKNKPLSGKGKTTELFSLEKLADGNTIIHRIHPLMKIVATFLFIIIVVSFGPYEIGKLIPFFFYPSILAALSDTPYQPLLKRLMLTLPFILFTGFFNILYDAKTAMTIGEIQISYGTISLLSILIKTYLTVMAVLILVSTTRWRDISAQMVRLKIPLIFVTLITLTYRYISVLIDEAESMMLAYRLRSPKYKGIRMKDAGSFLGQLLLRSIDRAERIYSAMLCRGYSGGAINSVSSKIKTIDWIYGFIVTSTIVFFRFFDIIALFENITY
ncbi:MAG: cobalt ECF transporter T component CbiQ [Flexilinea sp.]